MSPQGARNLQISPSGNNQTRNSQRSEQRPMTGPTLSKTIRLQKLSQAVQQNSSGSRVIPVVKGQKCSAQLLQRSRVVYLPFNNFNLRKQTPVPEGLATLNATARGQNNFLSKSRTPKPLKGLLTPEIPENTTTTGVLSNTDLG